MPFGIRRFLNCKSTSDQYRNSRLYRPSRRKQVLLYGRLLRSFGMKSAPDKGVYPSFRFLSSDPDQFTQVSPDMNIEFPVYLNPGIHRREHSPTSQMLTAPRNSEFQGSTARSSKDFLQFVPHRLVCSGDSCRSPEGVSFLKVERCHSCYDLLVT